MISLVRCSMPGARSMKGDYPLLGGCRKRRQKCERQASVLRKRLAIRWRRYIFGVFCASVIVLISPTKDEAFAAQVEARAISYDVVCFHDAGVSEKPPQPQRGCAEFQVVDGNGGQWINGEDIGVVCRDYDANRKPVPGVSSGIGGGRHLAVWKGAQIVPNSREDSDATPTINECKTQVAASAIRLDDRPAVEYALEKDVRPFEIGKGAFSDRSGLDSGFSRFASHLNLTLASFPEPVGRSTQLIGSGPQADGKCSQDNRSYGDDKVMVAVNKGDSTTKRLDNWFVALFAVAAIGGALLYAFLECRRQENREAQQQENQ
jgi:hypothetical protein